MIIYNIVGSKQFNYSTDSDIPISVNIKVYEFSSLIYETNVNMIKDINYFTTLYSSTNNKEVVIFSNDTSERISFQMIGDSSIDLIMRLNNLKEIEKFTPIRFLDVGAHIGNYSKMIKKIWSDVDIFMIEANPYNENHLKNVGYPYLISLLTDKKDQVYDFFVNKNDKISTGCSIYKEKTDYFSDENLEIIKLNSNTLDNLFENQQFDLIKLDTQGSEIDILKGGLNLISKCQYIIIETSIINYNVNAPLINEVLNFIYSVNYSMIDIIETHYLDNKLTQIDILFKNNKKYDNNSSSR